MIKSYYIKESVLNPLHDNLNPSIWDKNSNLRPEVKDQIIKPISEWIESVIPGTKIENLFFLGSNTGHQYSGGSDIDINVQIDIPDVKIEELFHILPNGNLLTGTLHPINYYLVNKLTKLLRTKGAAYDILNDKWIIEPSKENVEISFLYIIELAKVFMTGIDDRINELERDKKELGIYKTYLEFGKYEEKELTKEIERKHREIEAGYDSIKVIGDLIHSFRLQGFDEEDKTELIMSAGVKGDLSIQNQVYKVMDKFGYIEKLNAYKQLRKQYIAVKE